MSVREMFRIQNVIEVNERILFRMPKLCMSFLGIWPEIARWQVYLRMAFITLVLAFGTYTQWRFIVDDWNLWIHTGQMVKAVEAIAPTLVLEFSWVKMMFFVYQRPKLLIIIAYIKEIVLNQNLSTDTKRAFSMSCKIGYAFTFFLITSSCACVTLYGLVPVTMNFVRLLRGEEYLRILSFPIKFPFPIDWSPFYEVIYLYSNSLAYVCVVGFSGTDGLFISFCSYFSGQFQNIQLQLMGIIKDELGEECLKCDDQFTEAQNYLVHKKLQKIIDIHTRNIELNDAMVRCYVQIILINFFSAAIILCGACTALIMSSEVGQYSIFIFFVAAILGQLFVYCAGGTFIAEESSKVGEAAYFFEWYRADTRIQKMIILFILRAQRESQVKVPFIVVDAATFLNTVSSIASYITILKSFL